MKTDIVGTPKGIGTEALNIAEVIKRFGLEDEFLSILWKSKNWFENNKTGRGGYSEEYCKEKLKLWVEENVL